MSSSSRQSRTVTTVTKQPTKTVQSRDVNVGTPYINENVKLERRKGITVFRYVQIRRYAFVPPDFLIRLKSWFEKNDFNIKKNTRGYGHLAGRRRGVHLNFVPKFLVQVKQEADHQQITFTYSARIRKVGITAAIATQGITALVGAATLTNHVAKARQFIDVVTDEMDRIAGVCLGVQWCEAIEGGREVTTTTIHEVEPEPAPRSRPAPLVELPASPPRPAPVVQPQQPAQPSPAVVVATHAPAPQQQSQPQIIVVQTPAPMMYPMMPHMMMMPPYGNMGYMGYPQHMPQHMPQQQMLPPPSMPLPQPSVTQRPAMLSNTRYPVFDPAAANTSSMPTLEYNHSPSFGAPNFGAHSQFQQQPMMYNSMPSMHMQDPYTNLPSHPGNDVASDFNTYPKQPSSPGVVGMAYN